MTASTQILPFSTLAAGSGGTRLSPSAYAALTTLLANGFQVGIADEFQVNTVLAQSSFMAAGLAEFCVSQGVSVPDDGNLGNLVTEITTALTTLIAASTPGTTLTIPTQTKTGASYAYLTADNSYLTNRSNSGSAMTDTLPGTSGAVASGWYGYFSNTDASAANSVGVGSGGSIRVGSAATANGFVILPGELWLVVSQGSGNYIAGRIGAGALHTKPAQGSHKKLKGVWASSTTATYTADSVVLYDSAGNSRIITAFNKTLNTAVSGIGGLSNGSLAQSWYGVYAALNPATNTQQIFFDPSFTSPTVPSGYTYVALIGAVLTDGSLNLINFIQYDNVMEWVIPITIASGGTGSSYQAVAVSGSVAPIAFEIGIMLQDNGNNPNTTKFSTNNSSDRLVWDGANNSSSASIQMYWRGLLESSNVYYWSDNGAASLIVSNFTLNL